VKRGVKSFAPAENIAFKGCFFDTLWAKSAKN
jgi:hypothetical protein